MASRYILRKQPSNSIREKLSTYDTFTQDLLFGRGITTSKHAEDFFNPAYDDDAYDPFLLVDMEKAVNRIASAVDKKENIAFYTDFDADGISAGALLHDAFTKIGHTKFTNYIPHRDSEGYGFHKKVVDILEEKGVTLIVTADVGITDCETVTYAKAKGVDVIITDHHVPGGTIPEAIAVINPQRLDDFYPSVHLSGSGVAFKLIQALYQHARSEKREWIQNVPEGWEKWLLDLVAIATIADMMPLVEENRSLVHYGLLVLRKSRRPGIGALCKKLRLTQRFLSEDDIGFSIAPRINASSRMGSPETAFELLTTSDTGRAADLVSQLESLNNKRKGQVARVVRELNKKIPEYPEHKVIVVGNPNWNPALLGLAASSLVDMHGKTVCLWGREGTGNIKGSCRGNGEAHIVEMFRAVADKLGQFGGHEHAGGFSVTYDDVHSLPSILEAGFKKVALEKGEEEVLADAELDYGNLQDTHRTLTRFEPFGVGNPKPVFLCRDVHVHSIRQFGKEANHTEIIVAKEGRRENVRAVAFFRQASSFTNEPKIGVTVTIVCTLELSRFAGRTRLELRIVDIV
tara:strand:+ start:10398 stop:12119 length:1722 start_codon:yes stop_codon:yes gene_type:complete